MKESEGKMKEEIAAAVLFITRLVKKSATLKSETLEEFSNQLSLALVERFKNHWYQEDPCKGQAYRCLRVHYSEPADPVLTKAAMASGLNYSALSLPNELTVWVDPTEVTCRLGEIKGSECVLLSKKEENSGKNSATVDVDKLLERHHNTLQTQRERFQMFTARRKKVTFYNGRSNSPSQYMCRNMNSYPQTGTSSPNGRVSISPAGSPPNHFNYQPNYQRKNGTSFNKTQIDKVNYSFQQNHLSSYPHNDQYRWVKGADLVMA